MDIQVFAKFVFSNATCSRYAEVPPPELGFLVVVFPEDERVRPYEVGLYTVNDAVDS
jgi:hypothetical protein